MFTVTLIINILLVLTGIGLIYFSLKGQIRGKYWLKMGSFERDQYRHRNWEGDNKKKKSQ